MSSEWGSIGRRIAFRREDLGMSQVELAKLCHVNSTTVSKWERDVLKPTRNIMELAEALDVPATWILRGHFELIITKEKKDRALRAAKWAVNLVEAARPMLEGLPVGERIDRSTLVKLRRWFSWIALGANSVISVLPNPAFMLKTTKQRDASRRGDRELEEEFADMERFGMFAKLPPARAKTAPSNTAQAGLRKPPSAQ